MAPPLKSAIWKYFMLKDTANAQCALCAKIYSRKGRTTTSLKNHLRSMHPEGFSSYLSDDAESKTKTSQNEEKVDTIVDNQQKITCLAEAIMEDSDFSENSHQEEKRDIAAVDSEQRDSLAKMSVEGDSINSETEFCKVDVKDIAVNENVEETNSEKIDASLGDPLMFTAKCISKKRRKRSVIRWSDEEKRVTEFFFSRHIKMKIAPKKQEVIQLMRFYPKLFKDRKWDVVKVYVCNKYNSKSKNIACPRPHLPTDPIKLKIPGTHCDPSSVPSKEYDQTYSPLNTDVKEEPTCLIDPLLEENISEEINEQEKQKNAPEFKDDAKEIAVFPSSINGQCTFVKEEQQIYLPKNYPKKIRTSQKSPALLNSKVISANGQYLAVLKQLAQTGKGSQEKNSAQNSQTATSPAHDNIVLKRLVFDAEKRCFRAVDSNELINAMSKKIRVLSVNKEGPGKGVPSLNILQKVPSSLNKTKSPEKQSSFIEQVLPVSTDDMCVLCARKKSPTHNISHLVNLIKDMAGVNLSNLDLPLRACEECVADVNVTLKLRNSIRKAYEELVKKDDTVTIKVLPPTKTRTYGKNLFNGSDTADSERTSTVTASKTSSISKQGNTIPMINSVSDIDPTITRESNVNNPDGFKRIKLLKLNDDCSKKKDFANNCMKNHKNSETEEVCKQLCTTGCTRTESEKKDVTCKICNRSFRCFNSLKCHMRRHVYKCEVCYKTFVYGVAKKNHLKRQHTEQEIQKALENMRTDQEKSKSYVPHKSRRMVTLKTTKKEEKKQTELEEEEMQEKINEHDDDVILL